MKDQSTWRLFRNGIMLHYQLTCLQDSRAYRMHENVQTVLNDNLHIFLKKRLLGLIRLGVRTVDQVYRLIKWEHQAPCIRLGHL